MIEGFVTDEDVPEIIMVIAGREWQTIVDTGFNGFLELPQELEANLELIDAGPVESLLASNQVIIEPSYDVEVIFDGNPILANVTFCESESVLLGTKMLKEHRLEIDFPNQSLRISRASSD